MKKILILCVTLIFILAAYYQENYTMGVTSSVDLQGLSTQQSMKPITTDDLLKTMIDQEKCWMGLTPEQYLEDFDAFYKELRNNYPYFGVAQRKYNVSIESQYNLYRKQIETCKNDVDFWSFVRSFVKKLQYTGHIETWGYRYVSELEGLKTFIHEYPQYAETVTLYINKLENPVSEKNYKAMKNFYIELQRVADGCNKHMNDPVTNESGEVNNEGAKTFENVTTSIIQKGTIAYVSIETFDMSCYSEDKEILLPFYKSVKDYDNIIIDISDNPGGGMDYFNQLVVAPLANKTYRVSTFLLAKGGENNKYFLQIPKGLEEGTWQPVSNLPSLPHMNQNDLAKLDYFMEENYTVTPHNQQGFQGRVWLLVSGNNYSSSEYAAMFSKRSGFATLVGEKTGGDGIGVDPAYIILPNSGLVVQYSPIYGVTSDGKNSEEYGTEPDYYIQEGETALDACLRLIHDGSVQ